MKEPTSQEIGRDPTKMDALRATAACLVGDPTVWRCRFGDNYADFRGPNARTACIRFLRETFTLSEIVPPLSDYPTHTPGQREAGDLARAERLWAELQEDQLGGFSGINRPFWIVQAFREIREDERQRRPTEPDETAVERVAAALIIADEAGNAVGILGSNVHEGDCPFVAQPAAYTCAYCEGLHYRSLARAALAAMPPAVSRDAVIETPSEMLFSVLSRFASEDRAGEVAPGTKLVDLLHSLREAVTDRESRPQIRSRRRFRAELDDAVKALQSAEASLSAVIGLVEGEMARSSFEDTTDFTEAQDALEAVRAYLTAHKPSPQRSGKGEER